TDTRTEDDEGNNLTGDEVIESEAEEITVKELNNATGKIKIGKAVGVDEISPENVDNKIKYLMNGKIRTVAKTTEE
ncbi:hypothetical protein ILUMI_16156, partial [Ignelater luminosus]